jgi:hypothetical protein
MLKIRHSPNEVDISGSATELLMVRDQVLQFLKSPAKNFVLDTDAKADPTPYAKTIPKLQICKSSCATKVFLVSDSILRIEGTMENLKNFLSWFDVPVDAKPGHHGHFDSLDSAHVDKESIPTIVGVGR